MEEVTFQEILEGRKRGGVAHEHTFLRSDVMKGSKLELITWQGERSQQTPQAEGEGSSGAQAAGRAPLDMLHCAVVRR